MSYQDIKLIHAGLALISGLMFSARLWFCVSNKPIRSAIWRRAIPDSMDTTLLVTGLGLLWFSGLSLTEQPWLMLKLACLLAYIALGVAALHFASTQSSRLLYGLSAILLFAYMVSLAVGKQFLPFT